MQAYGVFAGGGVKGAALAGCLAAAQNLKIEFVGYAGTSAGSMIAALACVGYKGEDIRDLMKTTAAFHPLKFLDDRGEELKIVQDMTAKIFEIISSSKGLFRKGVNLWWSSTNQEEQLILQKLLAGLGLYGGNSLRDSLLKLMQEKLTRVTLQDPNDVKFSDLVSANLPPLKILASDFISRRGTIFSKDDNAYSTSVIQAVRASASYPFVFKPHLDQLVDGGLSSNLPVSLFAREQLETRHPILAFDLTTEQPGPNPKGFLPFCKVLLDTALESSDSLILDLIPGVEHIQVPIPSGIDTLKFDLTDAEVGSLYDRGYRVTTDYFTKKFKRWAIAMEAGEDIRKQLWTIYGEPKLYQPVLWAVAKMVEENSAAKTLRSSIMLPTGRPNRSRIVTYTYGFQQGHTDAFLELNEYGGCSGRALKQRAPVVADLEDAKTTFNPKWEMTEDQQTLVAQDRKAMISCPIFAAAKHKATPVQDLPVIGILSIDSSTPLSNTDWVTNDSINDTVYKALTSWADIISKILHE